MATVPQIRAARGLLGWSQTRLAEAARLSLPTVKRFETASALQVSEAAISAITNALEAAGIIFVEENGEGAGVRLRKAKRADDYLEPKGPATDAVRAMEDAIKRHQRSKPRCK